MLDVAVQVFAQRGYVATSMDEIAERVGVSKPMLYEYFNSKEGLLLAAIRDARNELRLVTEQAVLGATSGKEALERGLLAFFRFIDGRKEAWSLLRQEMAFIGSSASEEVEAIREQQTALNAKLLEAYLPIGAQREAEAAAELLVGACERIAVWCERYDDITPEMATRYTMNLIWDGLGNRRAAAESSPEVDHD